MGRLRKTLTFSSILFMLFCLALPSCGIIKGTYRTGKKAVSTTYDVTKGAVNVAVGTGRSSIRLASSRSRW